MALYGRAKSAYRRAMSTAPTPRTRVRRAPRRGVYELATIEAILDEALVAHVGFAAEGQPYVIPMLHARIGDRVFLHAASASRLVRALADGAPVCLTTTLLDGLVLARSAYHHSANYRSVVVLGTARPVASADERLTALRAFTDKLVPGRWDEVRPPTRQELAATRVLTLDLAEASAKVRSGGPLDDDADHALDTWAGVLPLTLRAGPPQPDERLPAHIVPSPAVRAWVAAHA